MKIKETIRKWVQKGKKKIRDPFFIIKELGDLILVTLFCMSFIWKWIDRGIFISYFVIYAAVYVCREIYRIINNIKYGHTNQKGKKE